MIIRKTTDENAFIFLCALLIFVGFAFLTVTFWPSVETALTEVLDMAKKAKLPRQVIGLLDGILKAQFVGWIAFRWFLMSALFNLTLAAVFLGIKQFAGERSRGTYEWLLSLPVSRSRIFIEKTLVPLAMLAMLNYIPSVLVINWLAPTIGQEIKLDALAKASTIQMSIFFLVYSFSVLFSVCLKDQMRAGGAAFFVIAGFMALSSGRRFRAYRPYNPYYWSDMPRLRRMFGVLIDANEMAYPWRPALNMAVIGIILLIIAYLVFLRSEP
ncbi:MAG TPA: ABC transporter permease subunit [Candidatus Brocadiia bacterium]|nr:ABC transporter permease subunit [Candidatus Brocadiia bacterium]